MLIDTSVVLAYLVGTEPTSELAAQLFDAFVATGRNPASLSMVTVEEILVRPFRSGAPAVARAEGFLRHFGDMRLVGVDYDVAREAARIRAQAGLATPDALILASAVIAGVDMLVTNDQGWKNRLPTIASGLQLCVLADVVPAEVVPGRHRRSLAGSLRAKTTREPSEETWSAVRDAAWSTPDPDRGT